jgi:GNAT superfamily N-acetyltransferase
MEKFTNIQIRKAIPGDAAALADILRNMGAGWFDQIKQEPVESTRQRINSQLSLSGADSMNSVYVAENDNHTLVGYVSVHWFPCFFLNGLEGYISELFIQEAFRGQGAGALLLDTVIAEGKKRDCSRLMLINRRSRESYQRGFYHKHGWEERAEMANFVYHLK